MPGGSVCGKRPPAGKMHVKVQRFGIRARTAPATPWLSPAMTRAVRPLGFVNSGIAAL